MGRSGPQITVVLVVPRIVAGGSRLGGSGSDWPRWAVGVFEQPRPLRFPLPVLRQVQDQPAGPADDPCRAGNQFPADPRGDRPGQPGIGDGARSAGEVERHDRAHQPGGIRGELPRRHMRQGAVLHVCVDLPDDRMLAMGLIRSDGVEDVQGAGGERGMEAVQVEQARLVDVLLIQLGKVAYD